MEFLFAPADEMRESPDEEKMRWRFLLFAPKALPFECALFNPTRVVAFE